MTALSNLFRMSFCSSQGVDTRTTHTHTHCTVTKCTHTHAHVSTVYIGRVYIDTMAVYLYLACPPHLSPSPVPLTHPPNPSPHLSPLAFPVMNINTHSIPHNGCYLFPRCVCVCLPNTLFPCSVCWCASCAVKYTNPILYSLYQPLVFIEHSLLSSY